MNEENRLDYVCIILGRNYYTHYTIFSITHWIGVVPSESFHFRDCYHYATYHMDFWNNWRCIILYFYYNR